LGVILYDLICGRRPADLPTSAPLWKSTRVPTSPTPKTIDRAIPASLNRICMKALSFNPEARYPTAGALASALTSYLQAGPEASPAPRRGNIGGLSIGVVVAASVLCLLLGMSFEIRKYARRPDSPPTVLIDGREPASLPAVPIPQLVRQPAPKNPAPPEILNEPAVRLKGSSKELRFHLKSGCGSTKGKESTLMDVGTVGQELALGHSPCQHCLKGLPRPGKGSTVTP
jgi:hypothetical protein